MKIVKLRTKITLGLGLTLVPVLVLGFISFGWSSTLTEGVAVGYQTRAESIGDRIDRFLFERYGDVQAFAVNSAVQRRASWYDRDDKDNAVTLAMNRYMALYGVYALMLAVDLDGKVIGLSTSDAHGRPIAGESLWERNFKSAPWFTPARDGNFTTSMPYSAPGNDQATGTVIVDPYPGAEVRGAVEFEDGATMGFAAPIKSESGEVMGVWVNFLDFASLESVATAGFSEFRALGASSGELRVVDNEGRTLLAEVQGRRPDGFQSQREAVDDPITAQALKGVNASGPVEDARTGRTTLVGSAHLRGAMGYPGVDWSVVVSVDKAEALAGVSRVQWTIAVVLAICVVAAALVMLTLVRQISAPIRRMTSAAKRVALGDVGGDIHHESRDEIGELASALQDMVGFVRENAAAAAALAEGDLSKAPTPRSADDLLATSFARAQETLGRVLVEARGLITSAQGGRLAERVDATSYGGAYRELVTGINELMAACQAPISEAKTVLMRVAERDLSVRMTGEYRGDWETVKSSINSALDKLEDAMSQVLVAADQVSTATTEITIGTQSLAQTATTQAGALDEVTSRLHDVSSAGRQTASNAQEARSMAQAANDSAGRGRTSMLELSRAIQEIKAASDRTAQIVKTIDEIAFQTNLLALNAAVEAARAGDAGRGFAVVADEVRSLAMRSAEAARTTAKMINEAVESAERGVALNAGVAKDLTEIDSQVRRVVEVMEEIAVAADAQSRGIVTANGSVEAISRAVQQNAATTEEAASGAEELAGQAQSLRELVSAFKVQTRTGLHLAPAVATGAPWRAKAKSRPPAPSRSSRRPRAQMGSAAQLIPFDEHESSPGGDF